VPRFYFRVATDRVRGQRLAAVCYGLVEGGVEDTKLHMLLVDEWGEKEILRKMKELGIFELGNAFVPIGPSLEEDLGLLVSRAIHHDILRLDDGSAAELIRKKLSGQSGTRNSAISTATGGGGTTSKVETNRQLVERLYSEAVSFLEGQSASSEPPSSHHRRENA